MHAPFRHAAFTLLLALLPVLAWAQTPPQAGLDFPAPGFEPVFERFDEKDGLPQSAANTLLQASDGWLWVGTFGGLARFDGHDFFTFPTVSGVSRVHGEPARAGGPPSNRFLSLAQDDRGRIWIGTQDAGIAVFDGQEFLHLPVCGGGCQINGFSLSGRWMWVATDVSLWRVDLETLHGEPFPGLPTAPLLGVATMRGVVYATQEGVLYRIEGDTATAIPAPPGTARIIELFPAEATLWATTYGEMVGYDTASGTWRNTGIFSVTDVAPTSDGGLWAGNWQGELWRMEPDGQVRDTPLPTPGSTIASVLLDDEGNMWLGTGSHGLIRRRQPWIGVLSGKQFGINAPARSIASGADGSFLFALTCHGVWQWRADTAMAAFSIDSPWPRVCFNELEFAADGSLWFGTSNGWLGRIRPDRETHSEVRWKLASEQPVQSIRQLPDGRLLAAAHRSTYRLELDENGDLRSATPIPALEGMTVSQLVPARSGGLWAVGDQGAWRLQGDHIVERWTPVEGLSSRFARSLYEDERGVLWIGTYGGGLNRIEHGQLRHFGRSDGLFDDTVSCLLADARGRLWMAGNRGVAVMTTDPGPESTGIETIGFAQSDGLIPSELNGGAQSACHMDTTGRLWFALVEGIGTLHPNDFERANATPPRVFIERVVLGGKTQRRAPELRLGANDSNLEIHFTAINLTTPERLRFRFRLSSPGSNWIETGSNRSIVFPSIPWGEHLFEVQARNEGGTWSESGKLKLYRPVPWHQKPWLWVLATSLGLLLVYSATSTRGNEEEEQP